ncbi:DoxX family protein [Nocardiopsis valliformis]|uniref:DoxX family protein n=1 Tax=Nocardiopsis valliformis TaxID=239974 RepID=UPI00034D9B63|nr:DoxX family protein [Nocardiopsis valliformis]
MPPIGETAALGLPLFFVGAVLAHLRARNHRLGFPPGYLALAAASLVLAAAS